jgi:type II secretory pathway pseudopilin PulG
MPEFANRGRARATARRAAAWLVGETGDTMVEVMVAALMVALIAAAVFVGFGSVADIAGAQRHQAAASTLAQQDQDRMRGLSVTQLSATNPSAPACTTTAGPYGNECYTETVDGETYTVTSTAKFVSASDGAASCTSSSTDNADYIETASTVTWANSNDGRPPVIEHSVISPHVGGGLVIQATDGSQPTPNPLPGVPIDVTGSDTGTLTLTTDNNGCAVFAGLPGGTYTVSWPGYIQENTGASSASVLVVDGNTETDSYELGEPGTIQASFTTTYGTHTNVAATTDTFVASNSQLTSPIVSGTPSTLASSASYSSTISSGATIFPLAGTNDAYSVYAGDCVGDAPPSPTTTVVAPGGTSNVTVPEPAIRNRPVDHLLQRLYRVRRQRFG